MVSGRSEVRLVVEMRVRMRVLVVVVSVVVLSVVISVVEVVVVVTEKLVLVVEIVRVKNILDVSVVLVVVKLFCVKVTVSCEETVNPVTAHSAIVLVNVSNVLITNMVVELETRFKLTVSVATYSPSLFVLVVV